jgi:hypothetical protein
MKNPIKSLIILLLNVAHVAQGFGVALVAQGFSPAKPAWGRLKACATSQHREFRRC